MTFKHKIDDRFIISEFGAPFKIVDKTGETLCVTYQNLIGPKIKSGFRIKNGDDMLKQLAKLVKPFAKSMGGKVELMTPDEYAEWSEKNDEDHTGFDDAELKDAGCEDDEYDQNDPDLESPDFPEDT